MRNPTERVPAFQSSYALPLKLAQEMPLTMVTHTHPPCAAPAAASLPLLKSCSQLVLVSKSCHNTISQTGGLKEEKIIFSCAEGQKSKIKVFSRALLLPKTLVENPSLLHPASGSSRLS